MVNASPCLISCNGNTPSSYQLVARTVRIVQPRNRRNLRNLNLRIVTYNLTHPGNVLGMAGSNSLGMVGQHSPYHSSSARMKHHHGPLLEAEDSALWAGYLRHLRTLLLVDAEDSAKDPRAKDPRRFHLCASLFQKQSGRRTYDPPPRLSA